MNIAFQNSVELMNQVKSQVAAHYAADEISQGKYWENGKGCFIGCIAHSDDVETVEQLTGFPVMLTRIAESIFECLPAAEAKEFLPAVINAVPLGADLSLTPWKFLHWCVTDSLEKYADSKTQVSCSAAVEVLRLKSEGSPVSEETASAAADAAADAADAAGGAAAYAAAHAADAAYAAAHAAGGAAASRAAYAAAYAEARREQAVKFIELLKGN